MLVIDLQRSSFIRALDFSDSVPAPRKRQRGHDNMREGGEHNKAIQADSQVIVVVVSKMGGNFNYIEVKVNAFTCLIMEFTKTENILIIYKNPSLSTYLQTKEDKLFLSTSPTLASASKKRNTSRKKTCDRVTPFMA